jgi:hypothetical protein
MIMMGFGCISVSRRGETKEIGVEMFIDGNAEKEYR